ncbi:MAG: hypothetical protein A4E30_01029 [Methanomassiliicoccales archaeon PtaB.Bin215]|nr:MAG: hypothetical protein A4E30_01029 [Methanomassiliicoccales archaeon PtaB.Bin215]
MSLDTRSADFSLVFLPMISVYRSWAMAPAAAMINPDTVPSMVAKAIDEMTAKNTSPPAKLANVGADRLLSLIRNSPCPAK